MSLEEFIKIKESNFITQNDIELIAEANGFELS